MQVLDILRSPRRWRELPAWAKRRWRARDPLLPGLLAGNRITLDGCVFDVSAVSLRIRSRLATGRYEAPERRFARELLDPDLPVIELGACLGVLGCIVNRRLRDPEHHVVVEANGMLLDAIANNRDLNGARFAIEHAAIGYGAPAIELHLHPTLVTASSAQRGFRRVVRVPATSLAALADRGGFARYQLVCDIEGAERALIETELAHLRDRVTLAIVELHPDVYGDAARANLIAMLEGAGFERAGQDDNVVALRRATT